MYNIFANFENNRSQAKPEEINIYLLSCYSVEKIPGQIINLFENISTSFKSCSYFLQSPFHLPICFQ